MSRSKKNWDHLVDYYGNYFPLDFLFEEDDKGNLVPIDIKGDPGDKGEKGNRGFRGPRGEKGHPGVDGIDGIDGDKGDKGTKGDAEGLLHFQGTVPERGDLPDPPAPGTEGDVYRVELTGYYYISAPSQGTWVEVTGIEALQGPKGEVGPEGPKGDQGSQGDSLTWDDLTDLERESLKGEKGDQGDSAYDVAVEEGFPGTKTEWVEGLKGDKGDEGKSLIFDDLTQSQKNEIKGEKGDQGQKGSGFSIVGEIVNPGEDPNGNPVYVCDAAGEGNALVDPSDGHIWICDGAGGWIDGGLLVGPEGEKGVVGDQGIKGEKGEIGDSAFESAEKGGFSGTEQEWVNSLKGTKGDKGVLPLISDLPPL